MSGHRWCAPRRLRLSDVRTVLSIWYWGYGITCLVIFWFIVAIPWLLITPFDRRRVFAHWYAYTWADHLNWMSPFWDVIVEGREKMRDDTTYVLVANHQSSADIFVLFALRKQFRWVAKRELFAVPFLGWMMAMAGYVPIKRGKARSRERMLGRCMAQLKLGNTVALFPEGTRSTTDDMRPFKLGAFVLACEAKVAVLPVLIEGTRDVLPREDFIFPGEGKVYVRVRVLDPIHPDDHGGDFRALMRAVRGSMTSEQRKLRAEIEHLGGLHVRPPR